MYRCMYARLHDNGSAAEALPHSFYCLPCPPPPALHTLYTQDMPTRHSRCRAGSSTVQAVQPWSLHQPHGPAHVHTLPHGTLYRQGRPGQMQALSKGKLLRPDGLTPLHQVPHRLLLLHTRSQQVHVLPARIIHQRDWSNVLQPLPVWHLLDALCSRLQHHLRGLSCRLFQLQARVDRVHAVSCRTVHREASRAGLQGLPLGHLQHFRRQLEVLAVQSRLHNDVHRQRQLGRLQCQGLAGWQHCTNQG